MSVPIRPPDLDTDLAQPYWEGFRAGELRLPRCEDCGEYHWYPKPACPKCGSRDISWETVDGQGTLFTWVGVEYDFDLPFLADAVPLYTGLVTLDVDESIRLAALVEPPADETPEIGSVLEPTFPEPDAEYPAPVYVPR